MTEFMNQASQGYKDGASFAMQNPDPEKFNYLAGIDPINQEDSEYVGEFELGFDQIKISILMGRNISDQISDQIESKVINPLDVEKTTREYFQRKEIYLIKSLGRERGKDWATVAKSSPGSAVYTPEEGLEFTLEFYSQDQKKLFAASQLNQSQDLKEVFSTAFLTEAKKILAAK